MQKSASYNSAYKLAALIWISYNFWKGTIHILRGWEGGVGKMLTFAYMVGGSKKMLT